MNLSLNVYILFDCQNEEEYFHRLALLDTQFIFSVDFLVFYWMIDAWGITELHTFEANMQISLNLSLCRSSLSLSPSSQSHLLEELRSERYAVEKGS